MSTWKKVVTETNAENNGSISQHTTGYAGSITATIPISQGGTGRNDLHTTNNDQPAHGLLWYNNTSNTFEKAAPTADEQVLTFNVSTQTFEFIDQPTGEAVDLSNYVTTDSNVSFNNVAIAGTLSVDEAIIYGSEYQYTTGNTIVLNSDGSGFASTAGSDQAGLEIHTGASTKSHIKYIHPSSATTALANFKGQWVTYNDDGGTVDSLGYQRIHTMKFGTTDNFTNGTVSTDWVVEGQMGFAASDGNLYICTSVS